jgi:hypothetical protein
MRGRHAILPDVRKKRKNNKRLGSREKWVEVRSSANNGSDGVKVKTRAL